jgi:peroxiredoxin family protein
VDLREDDVTVDRRPEDLAVEVRYGVQKRGPVGAHLGDPLEGPDRKLRLLAPIVLVEAGEHPFEVVRVLRSGQAVDHGARVAHRVSIRPAGEGDPPLAVQSLGGERKTLVGGQRGEVDRGLGVGGEDDERVSRAELGKRSAGVDERQWAGQAAGVEGSYDQGMIAAFLESGELERLYTGLSLLVSAAAEGRPARALVGFGAMEPMLDERLLARALSPDSAPAVSHLGREAFAHTLTELRDAALELEDCRVWACAAAVEATGVERAVVEARLAGVMSVPRFLREVDGAQLVVV